MASVDAAHSLAEPPQQRSSFAVGRDGLESKQALLRSSAEWAIMGANDDSETRADRECGPAALLECPSSTWELLARHITRGVGP